MSQIKWTTTLTATEAIDFNGYVTWLSLVRMAYVMAVGRKIARVSAES